mmetsp:Transcript_3950/g.7293  ORF Transcript_3950/g.7293 Transcript_3950/m.7293 type:complete len:104 (+) Transcript_3950:607-918(+)
MDSDVIKRDLEKARHYFERATSQGFIKARDKLVENLLRAALCRMTTKLNDKFSKKQQSRAMSRHSMMLEFCIETEMVCSKTMLRHETTLCWQQIKVVPQLSTG